MLSPLKRSEKNIFITKASGEREPFDEVKFRRSLKRAGAKPEVIEKVVIHIRRELTNGMHTRDIYKNAFQFLREQHHATAAKYGLKHAVFDLGPSGFAFEDYVAELLKAQGYAVETRVAVPGRCVTHEVDVVAKKDNRHILVECKFHNQAGVKSNIKIALYVQARYEDIQRRYEQDPKHMKEFHEIWLVTNTKVTHDAIRYAECMGMRLISWNYPKGKSLRDLIESTGFHPITCMTTLSKDQKHALLATGVVLSKTIATDPKVLASIGLTGARATRVATEAAGVCQID